VINLDSPRIESFSAGEYALVLQGMGLAPTINTGAPWGPAKAIVALESPAMTHVVLYGMRWEDALNGDIEIHFFCYPDRVVARMDIIPHAVPPSLLLGWVGAVTQAGPFPEDNATPDWRSVLGVEGPLARAAVLLPPLKKGPERERGAHVRIERGKQVSAHYIFNAHDIGIRSIACTLFAANDENSLLDAMQFETEARRLNCTVTNGRYAGYDALTGLHRFVAKPGAQPVSITFPNQSDAGIDGLVAAVSAMTWTPVHIEGIADPAAVHWMPRTFSPVVSDGPGAYVFNVELRTEPHTVTLRPIDSSAGTE